MHWGRWQQHGDPLYKRQHPDICTVEGCERPHVALGWCRTHYSRVQRHGEPGGAQLLAVPNRSPICTIDGCDAQHEARGYCARHYERWRRHGDPLICKVIVGDDERRFWSYVSDADERGCRIWRGAFKPDGYGHITIKRRLMQAHQYALVLTGREIPDGYEVDHMCRVRLCVEVAHLDIVTHAENRRRQLLTPEEHFALRLVMGW